MTSKTARVVVHWGVQEKGLARDTFSGVLLVDTITAGCCGCGLIEKWFDGSGGKTTLDSLDSLEAIGTSAGFSVVGTGVWAGGIGTFEASGKSEEMSVGVKTKEERGVSTQASA